MWTGYGPMISLESALGRAIHASASRHEIKAYGQLQAERSEVPLQVSACVRSPARFQSGARSAVEAPYDASERRNFPGLTDERNL